MSDDKPHEPLVTLPQASLKLGVPVSALRRASKRGVFPTYNFGNRNRVFISEIMSAVQAAQVGGENV